LVIEALSQNILAKDSQDRLQTNASSSSSSAPSKAAAGQNALGIKI